MPLGASGNAAQISIYEQAGATLALSTATRNRQFLEASADLERFCADIQKQHELLVSELTELIHAPMRDCHDTAETLVETADQLEALFAKIDQLELIMDNIYEKTNMLADTVKEIQTPADVSERAKNAFRSFFGSKEPKSAQESGVWSRIPPRLILDGSPPKEFSHRFRGIMSDLDAKPRAAQM